MNPGDKRCLEVLEADLARFHKLGAGEDTLVFTRNLVDTIADVLVRLEAVEEVVAEHAGRLPPSRSGDVIERRRIAPPCRTCRSVFADVSQLANHTAYFCAGCGDVLFVHSPAPDKEG